MLAQGRLDDPRLLGAVDGDEHPRGHVLGRLAQEPVRLDAQEAVLVGNRVGAAQHHHGVLPEGDEREVEREQRADGVPVGVLVRGDGEPVVLAEHGQNGVQVTLVSTLVSVGRRELVDQLGHVDAVLDRAIVDELELRSPPQLELAVDARLQDARARSRAPPASSPAGAHCRRR